MRIGITGATGQLGTQLLRAFAGDGHEVVPLARPAFDLENPVLPSDLDLVVNAAAWTDVDGCASDPDRAMRLNGDAPGHLAAAAERSAAGFIQISTNEVFSGRDRDRYDEGADPHPINAYGRSKLAGERAVTRAHPGATVVRTAWIHGGPRSFPVKIRAAAERAAAAGEPLRVVADEIGNPTPADQLADRIARLATLPDPPRVVHLAGEPAASRFDWALAVLADVLDAPRVEPIRLDEFRRASTPPPHAVLDTTLSRSVGLPPIKWVQPARRG